MASASAWRAASGSDVLEPKPGRPDAADSCSGLPSPELCDAGGTAIDDVRIRPSAPLREDSKESRPGRPATGVADSASGFSVYIACLLTSTSRRFSAIDIKNRSLADTG